MTAERLPWISVDPASQSLFELAQRVAAVPTTLLITGESGSGKDYLARVIHELGPRRDAPFLKIDCASLPAQLVESELFGHERGAFTGAIERKLGRFELGGNGTIVLDEVAALSAAAQSKLLRVLQERAFERLGNGNTVHRSAPGGADQRGSSRGGGRRAFSRRPFLSHERADHRDAATAGAPG